MATTAKRVPKWQTVLTDLEARLATGEFEGAFPTDRELVDTYGVSRQTVREAVRHLKALGVVERARGRGAAVSRPEFLQSLGTLYSVFQAVEAQGIEQRSEVLAQGWSHDSRPAGKLGVEADAQMFHLERIRYAGDEPLALDTVWLPEDIGAALVDVDFSRTSIYQQIRDRVGEHAVPTRGEETITPLVPDEHMRSVLSLEPDEGVLRIERRGYDAAGRAVECRLTLVRGSRFALTSTWPSGAASTTTAQIDPTKPW